MQRPIQRLRHRLPLILLITLLWLSSACRFPSPGAPELDADVSSLASSSRDSEALAGKGNQGDYFPLDFGNRWEHETVLTFVIVPDGGEPGPLQTFRTSSETEVIGTEILFGTSYVLLESRWTQEGEQGTYWLRYRQDRSGLYQADVSVLQPPSSGLRVLSTSKERRTPAGAVGWESGSLPEEQRQRLAAQLRQRGVHPGFLRALDEAVARHAMIREVARTAGLAAELGAYKASRNAGPLAQEITRLRYPLHPGASWIIRDDPRVTATVEAADPLALRAGRFASWRIRIDWPDDFGPRDLVHVWYGRCGELQFEAHLEGIALDENGQPVGLLISDESEVLVGLDLARGGCR